MFLEQLLNNLGWGFSIFLFFLLFFMLERMIAIYQETGAARQAEFIRTMRERGQRTLPNRKDSTVFGLAFHQQEEWAWTTFERLVEMPLQVIQAYAQVLMLGGFVGTCWGSITSFGAMMGALSQASPIEAMSKFSGGLQYALWSSLVPGVVSIILYLWIHSSWFQHRVSTFRLAVLEELDSLLADFSDSNQHLSNSPSSPSIQTVEEV